VSGAASVLIFSFLGVWGRTCPHFIYIRVIHRKVKIALMKRSFTRRFFGVFMYCKGFKGVLRSTNFQSYSLALVRVRCKKWSCLYCAEKNALMWRVSLTRQMIEMSNIKAGSIRIKKHRKMIYFMPADKCKIKPSIAAIAQKRTFSRWAFFTVTVALRNHKGMTPDERLEKSALIFKHNADRLMKRLRRQYGSFAYVRVLEQCANGQLHAHFIGNIKFTDLIQEPHKGKDKKTAVLVSVSPSLKKVVIECGFGWASHAENLSSEGDDWSAKRVVGYITKYITKSDERITDFCRTEKIRKMQTSRHFISPFNDKNKGDSEADWFISLPIHISMAEDLKFSVYDLNRKKELTADDFTLSDYYPKIEE